jgi:hypothetical protein
MNLSQLDWVGLAVATVLVIVWLVRLEGRVNGKADASHVQAVAAAIDTVKASGENMKTDIGALHQSAKAGEETKIEVVRLQEQIKHLTNLFEKWLQPSGQQSVPARRRTTTVEEG